MVFILLGTFENSWMCDNLSFIIFPKMSAIIFLIISIKKLFLQPYSLFLVFYDTNYIHKKPFYIVPHLSSLKPCSGLSFFSLWAVTIDLFFSSLMSQLKAFLITVTMGFSFNA